MLRLCLSPEENTLLTCGFSGPDRSRICDLTRARCAEVTYRYPHAFTFSAIYAGQTAIAAHTYSHLPPPVPNGDVGDLLGALNELSGQICP